MQNVTILGITLQDRSLSEAMSASKRFLTNGALDVVAYVDHDVLTYAERNDAVRDFLSRAAMTLWEDKKILRLVGITDPERYTEVESRAFLRDLLGFLSDSGRSVVVAGPDENGVGNLREELLKIMPGLNIVHETIIETSPSRIPEADINDINEHFPAVVIARMDYAQQQDWLALASPMINAGIWLALPPGMRPDKQDKEGWFRQFLHKLSFGVFSRRAKKAMEG